MANLFYFAWADADDAFSDALAVEDEEVKSFTVQHDEGQCATLNIEIAAPRGKGLLAAGHKQWMWLSWDDGTTDAPIALFFGRVVGTPSDLLGETVTLTFVARPQDFIAQKRVLAEAMRTLPYYDPIFIDDKLRDDPDVVLDGYSARWHVNRVTLEVTTSDILVGEDGTEEFLEDDHTYSGTSTQLGQTPVKQVRLDATVTWNQRASGILSIYTPTVESYTGGSLVTSWPKPGTQIGDGYTAVDGTFAYDANGIDAADSITGGYKFEDKSANHNDGDTLSAELNYTLPVINGNTIRPGANSQQETSIVVGDPETGRAPSLSVRTNFSFNGMYLVVTHLNAQYDASRPRTEHLTFTLSADFQAILTDPGSDALEVIPTITGGDVGQDLIKYDADTGDKSVIETLPIVDPARRSYFPTERGLQSIEYLINLARAHILNRSRAIRITFNCSFDRAVMLSCRKNVLLHDRRIPGGQAVGKITSYQFSVSGGRLSGQVTIDCAIGYGGAVIADPGTADYVDDAYVDPAYQHHTGNIVALGTGDIGYSTPIDAPNDDGLVFPLTVDQVLVRNEIMGTTPIIQDETLLRLAAPRPLVNLGVDNPLAASLAHAQAIAAAEVAAINALRDQGIWVEVELKPVNTGPFENSYDIDLTELAIPKQIDLESTA